MENILGKHPCTRLPAAVLIGMTPRWDMADPDFGKPGTNDLVWNLRLGQNIYWWESCSQVFWLPSFIDSIEPLSIIRDFCVLSFVFGTPTFPVEIAPNDLTSWDAMLAISQHLSMGLGQTVLVHFWSGRPPYISICVSFFDSWPMRSISNWLVRFWLGHLSLPWNPSWSDFRSKLLVKRLSVCMHY